MTDRFLELQTGALLFAFLLSGFLYGRSFRQGCPRPLLAAGGNTGYAVYDFFIGRELNPRRGPRRHHPGRTALRRIVPTDFQRGGSRRGTRHCAAATDAWTSSSGVSWCQG